jgi:predicted nuclease with TOPRIM domain
MESDRQLLELVLQKLEELENSHLNLERKVDEIHKNTKRMEDHIDFVEKTYDKVKTPFHYLMDKVSLLSFFPFRKSEITQSEKEKLENKESN